MKACEFKYYVYKSMTSGHLAWCGAFTGNPIEVSKRQFYFLWIVGFLCQRVSLAEVDEFLEYHDNYSRKW